MATGLRSDYGTILHDWLKTDSEAILGKEIPNPRCVNPSYVQGLRS
jgi:hypothetical protein